MMKDTTPLLMKVEFALLLVLHVFGLAWTVGAMAGIV